MEDPYKILGVPKDASEAALRAAYRKLAKRHHPDLNPGKPEAAERFKTINAAYEILSDAEKRGRYDRGEIDAEGHEKPPEQPFYRDVHAGGGPEAGRSSAPRSWKNCSAPSRGSSAAAHAPGAAAMCSTA